MIHNKFAARWLANSFDGHNDEFLQLKQLEEDLERRYGTKVALNRPDGGVKPSYSEAVKNNKAPSVDDGRCAGDESRRRRIGSFEAHTKGIGRRIMENQGWRDGCGLGNGRKPGLKSAVKAVGQPATCRYGLGYKDKATKGAAQQSSSETEEEEEQGFQKPRKAANSPKPNCVENLETQNRFSLLTDEESDSDGEAPICALFKRKGGESKGDAKRIRRAIGRADEEVDDGMEMEMEMELEGDGPAATEEGTLLEGDAERTDSPLDGAAGGAEFN